MQTKVQVYTSLFDIGRDRVDGRSLQNYQNWLFETIRLFPQIIIFHDGSCDGLVEKGSQLVRVEKSRLEFFEFLPYVSELTNYFSPKSPNDITFRLPEYSLVQFSKFELALKSLEISGAESVMWVDAGISRFLNSSNSLLLNQNATKLIREGYSFAFEINLRKNLDFKRLKISSPLPGSCGRVISGTSFWIHEGAAQKLVCDVKQLLKRWKSDLIWDNEQVALRTLYESPLKLNSSHFVLQKQDQTGSVARRLSNSRIVLNKKMDNLIRNRLIP